MEYCLPLGWPVGSPTLEQLLDFFEALASGACMDRGKGRLAKGMGVLSAMKFASWKLEMSELRKLLDSTLVKAWSCRDKWRKGRTREAIPLSLRIVKRLELASLSAPDSAFSIDDFWKPSLE